MCGGYFGKSANGRRRSKTQKAHPQRGYRRRRALYPEKHRGQGDGIPYQNE
ncbi:MAG: hypothetical protein Q3983_00860 [Capnocytophaga sp.]|nr:hypothetical protein [Capnocytophaga sp.]